jgi:hypothetical protein
VRCRRSRAITAILSGAVGCGFGFGFDFDFDFDFFG